MNNYNYPNNKEQELLMNLVCSESLKRGQSYDNYNTQELAFRQAISDGAMRLKVEDHKDYILRLLWRPYIKCNLERRFRKG